MTPLARALSIVLHPFATMVAFAAVAGGPGRRLEAVLVAAGIVVPVAALVAQRRLTARWRTVDASDPRDRPALYVVAALAVAAALAAVLVGHAVPAAARPLLGVGLVFALGAGLNRRVKASLHVAFAAFASAALLASGSQAGWAFAAAVPPLAWSRVRLGRHTAPEGAAGAAIGLAAALVVAAG